MHTKRFTVIIGLVVQCFHFLFGFTFEELTPEEQVFHCFLLQQAITHYRGTPAIRGTSANVFAVGFELCYRTKSPNRFFCVNTPFVSQTENKQRFNIHKKLECPCEKQGLNHSEFAFLCELGCFMDTLETNGELDEVQIVRIHGFSTNDMCGSCFTHMSLARDKLNEEHEGVFNVEIYISSLFDYEKGSVYTFGRSRNICCIPLRNMCLSKSPFRINFDPPEELILKGKDVFLVEAQGAKKPILPPAPELQMTQAKIGRYCPEVALEGMSVFTNFTADNKVEIRGVEGIENGCSVVLGKNNHDNCLKLKYYCLGIENPLAFREYLDVDFARVYEGCRIWCANELMRAPTSPTVTTPAGIVLRELILPVVTVSATNPTEGALGHCTMFGYSGSPEVVSKCDMEDHREKLLLPSLTSFESEAPKSPSPNPELGYTEEEVEDFFANPGNPATSPKDPEEDVGNPEKPSLILECTPTVGCDPYAEFSTAAELF